jgi:hypothetical protein
VKGFFINDSGQTEVGDEQVRVFSWGAEQKVLGFQIYVSSTQRAKTSMYDSMIM